ncbi:MAG TPA: hypothetical protein VMZ52_20500 [Bryobacteraceae bacterium]|nr:hypothetical protein [Bryobacteraceae bacterium]
MASSMMRVTAEDLRLLESRERSAHWKRWGPYLSERAWGTVREDYSPYGATWDYFPHEHARSRAYRWNEDGLGGICDRHQRICFALALWNGRDPILKERLFGLNGEEGNHGEDVKECYYYLDSTPTHSYMKYLYKYPQRAYPYEQLVRENARRGKHDPEFEIEDTGVFEDSRYFDVLIEYAKSAPETMAIRITVANRGSEAATLHLLPTLWFRNRWSWHHEETRPEIRAGEGASFVLTDPHYGKRWLTCSDEPELLFTENETNYLRLFGGPAGSPYVKDSFHDYVIHNDRDAVNPARTGTKAAAHYRFELAGNSSTTVYLCLSDDHRMAEPLWMEPAFADRIREADEFYDSVIPAGLSGDARNVMRQAFGGMMWSKQFYHYVVKDWLDGDSGMPPPPPERRNGRNQDWKHVFNADVISMPDKWEYPWYASWDLAFHCLAISLIDADFAKEQLVLMLREWYMHPNGQMPAYEWALGDVNPPVHAWAALRVYKIEKKRTGKGDRMFLERIFHKLLLNFTWWVNRKDSEGNNIFDGGFLGLDNIGIFDRSKPLPTGGHMEQADGTGWMAAYTLNLLAIAMELAGEDATYEDVASKFWEHFLYIADAITRLGDDGCALWDEQDAFFYDAVHLPDGGRLNVKIRSMVGLIPLLAVETLDADVIDRLPGFKRRMEWFLRNRTDLTSNVACMRTPGRLGRRLLSIVNPDQLRSVLRVMLDEAEFLSGFGIRSLSRRHQEHPFVLQFDGVEHSVFYDPAESTTGLFGGNSNWRGPIWVPVNYLLIESLQKYHYYFGDEFTVEFPSGSGTQLHLGDIAAELSRRLTRIFLRDEAGARPVNGSNAWYKDDPHWRDLVTFYEYFHGDTGAGLGASHQTGWTGLVAKLLQQSGE